MEMRSLLGKTAGEGRTGVVEKAVGKQRSCSAPEGCGLENPEGRGESGQERLTVPQEVPGGGPGGRLTSGSH